MVKEKLKKKLLIFNFMIDHKYKFIFVHIPRTGTSIEKLLFKGSNDYKECSGYNSEYKLFAQHATIKQLKTS